MKTKFFPDKDKLYFTSDQHFMHANVIKFCKRPYENVLHMGKDFIDKWNAKISDDDTVFILGDFCWGGKKHWVYYISQLNGHKILVPGNHDKSIPLFMHMFDVWDDLAQISVYDGLDKQYIALCHYPMQSWYRSHHGSWQLYGHMHGECNELEAFIKYRPTQIDVGVDAQGYAPVSYEEVKCQINSRLKESQ